MRSYAYHVGDNVELGPDDVESVEAVIAKAYSEDGKFDGDSLVPAVRVGAGADVPSGTRTSEMLVAGDAEVPVKVAASPSKPSRASEPSPPVLSAPPDERSPVGSERAGADRLDSGGGALSPDGGRRIATWGAGRPVGGGTPPAPAADRGHRRA